MEKELLVENKIRVKYADTDRMNRVYCSKYLEYFEIGKTELFKKHFVSFKRLEDKYNFYIHV